MRITFGKTVRRLAILLGWVILANQAASSEISSFSEVVVPAAFDTLNGGNDSNTLETRQRMQQVYGAEMFPAEPILIRELRWRPSGLSAQPFSASITDIQVNLSSTLSEPDQLNRNFDQNTGNDETIVYLGGLHFTSSAIGPPGGPYEFDIVLPLTVPFLYNASVGNLLVDIRNVSGSSAGYVDLGFTPDDRASRLFSGSLNSPTGTANTGADVIQVIYTRMDGPPAIFRQPQDTESIQGERVIFSAVVDGAPPLIFQWHLDDNPIHGATNQDLTLPNVQLSSEGKYWIRASNSLGSVTSRVARLSILDYQGMVIPSGFQDLPGNRTSDSLRTPIRLQQLFEATLFPQGPILVEQLRFRPSDHNGFPFRDARIDLQVNLSTSQTLSHNLTGMFADHLGNDDTRVFQGELSLSSRFVGPVEGPKAFDMIVPLDTPFPYHPGQGNLLIDIRNFSGSHASFVDSSDSLIDQAARMWSPQLNSNQATFNDTRADIIQVVYRSLPDRPHIFSEPVDVESVMGDTAYFDARAGGSLPLGYQWFFNETAIPGATNLTLILSGIAPSQAGSYWMTATNAFGSTTSRVASLNLSDLRGSALPPDYQMASSGEESATFREAHRSQQVYGSSLFPTQPILIRELRFRPGILRGQPFISALTNIHVQLSTTRTGVDSLNTSFLSNHGEDRTTVFSGELALSSVARGPAGGPNEFDIIIPLQCPFPYDPAQGNLVVDIRNPFPASASYIEAVTQPNLSTSARIHSSNSLALLGEIDTQVDIMQLVFEELPEVPSVIQEPQTQTVPRNGTAYFKALVGGSGPLAYQWFFDSAPLTGATNLNLFLESIDATQTGPYWLRVSNAFGSVTSQVAILSMTNLESLVVSDVFESAPGTFGSTVFREAVRWQDVYGASLFPKLPILIQEIRLRPHAQLGQVFRTIIDPLQVRLSTSDRGVDNLAGDLDGNLGDDLLEVFHGPVELESEYQGPNFGPKVFDIAIPFTIPFPYDPLDGNLLVDIQNKTASLASHVDGGIAPNDQASRAFDPGAGSAGLDSRAHVLEIIYRPLELPPRIIASPTNTYVLIGDAIRLKASARGTPPLAYQWFRNSLPIDKATNSTLTLTRIQLSDEGSYTLQVDNAFGVATSAPAFLTVTNYQRLVLSPVHEKVDAFGASPALSRSIRIQNVYDSHLLPGIPIRIHEVRFRPDALMGNPFQTTLTNIQVTLSTATRSSDELGVSFSLNFNPDKIEVLNGSLTIGSDFVGPPGGPMEFDIRIPFSQPFHFNPTNGNLLVEFINFDSPVASLIDSGAAFGDGASRVFTSNPLATIVSYIDSSAEVMEIIYSSQTNQSELIIYRQPETQAVLPGEAAEFHVGVAGTPPIHHHWYHNGTELPGETNVNLILNSVQPVNAGSYSVLVSNVNGTITSESAELRFRPLNQSRLIREPYLQSGTKSNIVVRWRTDFLNTGSVRFGLEPDQLAWEVTGGFPTNEHLLVLTNLQPNTRYYYAVAGDNNILAGGADYTFKTASLGSQPIRIWAVGDSGTVTRGILAPLAIRDAYISHSGGRSPDVWLMLGDNAYESGTDEEYQIALFSVFQSHLRSTPLWPTIGNHEVWSQTPDGHIPYYDIFTLPTDGRAGGTPSGTSQYYSFDHGNVHFVCLDSEIASNQPGDPMLNWLEADLSSNTKDWILAYWHSPPYSHGSHNSDRERNLERMRENVVPVLDSHGVDLVLCGHSHNYERSYLLQGHYGESSTLTPEMILDSGSGRPEDTGAYRKGLAGNVQRNGAVYVVAGSSGQVSSRGDLDYPAMFLSLRELGSLVIDIDGHRLDARFLRETGAIDDHFTIIKVDNSQLDLTRINVDNGVVSADWRSVAGHVYRIQRTDTLDNPSWTTISDDIVATNSTSSWSAPIPLGEASGYFRVLQTSP